ncbi:(2Fe-2S)-binding protein [Inconstantimicrobium mannanitabidum]|uniref:Uncharacterized protein n=1 Tax=Inconstantimicrobium mannanitabidum TaxID=1604901 RepID=A0ACB5R6Q8_9CLOT|nr:(2Fe-2S)-binding protein [Clostridium sp. TW13]GKX64791.1 hypothetical protein rsdtw13_00490 [Clostridium sp. TW13]
MDKSEVVCNCMNVTVQDLEDAVKNGAKSFEEVQEATQVSTGCGGCEEHAREIVNQLLGK